MLVSTAPTGVLPPHVFLFAKLGTRDETRTHTLLAPPPQDGVATITPPGQKLTWCHELDSNQPHTDFQSAALPDELPRQYGTWTRFRTADPLRVKETLYP